MFDEVRLQREYDEHEQKVAAELAKMGVRHPSRPKIEEAHRDMFQAGLVGQYFDGNIPTSFSRLALRQLEDLHTIAAAWFSYIANQLIRYQVSARFSKTKKDSIWGMVRGIKKAELQNMGLPATGRDQAAADLTSMDGRFVLSNALYLKEQAMCDVLNNLRDVAENNVSAVSRAITVRVGGEEHMHRGRGLGQYRGSGADRSLGRSSDVGVEPASSNNPAADALNERADQAARGETDPPKPKFVSRFNPTATQKRSGGSQGVAAPRSTGARPGAPGQAKTSKLPTPLTRK